LEMNKLHLMDCMEAMREFPDNFFDIAVVDPPYGNAENSAEYNARNGRFGGRFERYDKDVERTGGTWAAKYAKKIKSWDTAPPPEYFEELFRISKNQIIWGGNYFRLPPTRCFLVWHKLTISETFTMAMAEYAWTSFNENAKLYSFTPQGTKKNPRFHPTQKPVELYEWQLRLFAAPGMKVIDTHAGSGSSLIAAHNIGLDWIGFEIDPDYYQKAEARLNAHMAQIRF